MGLNKFYNQERKWSYWLSKINCEIKLEKNSKWIKRHFLYPKSLKKCFENVFLIYSNMRNICSINMEEESSNEDRKTFETCILFAFYPNLIELRE